MNNFMLIGGITLACYLYSAYIMLRKLGLHLLNKDIVFVSAISILVVCCYITFKSVPDTMVFMKLLCVVNTMIGIVGASVFRTERRLSKVQFCLILALIINALILYI